MDETNSDAEKSPFAQDAAGNDDSGTVICTDNKNSADSIDQTSPEIHEPKRSRSNGRKSSNPTKLVRQTNRFKYNFPNDVYPAESKQPADESDVEMAVTVKEEETSDNEDTECDGAVLIQPIKWDKRRRLSVSKDFTKLKRQQPHVQSGTAHSSTSPGQKRFDCFVCGRPFLDAAESYEHMCTYHNMAAGQSAPFVDRSEKPMLVGKDSEHLHQQSTSDTGSDGEMEDYFGEEEVEDEDSTNASQDLGEHSNGSAQLVKKKRLREPEHGAMDKGFECQQCGKRFAEQRGLSQHLRVHIKNKCLSCPICDQVCSSSFLLAEHKREHAGERPFKCGFVGCDRYFPNAHEARRHGRMHSKDRPFVCKHCDKAFKAPNHLREHLRLHTGERPFVCEVCGLGFAQSNGLKSHSKQHLKKPSDSECHICNKIFPYPSSLVLHMQVHQNDRPFTCELCNKTFRTSCNLGAHRKLKHLDVVAEKVFTCDDCGATFSKACNLGIHRKKKHSSLPAEPPKIFVCNICDATFSEACNLGAHKKIKHADEMGSGRPVFDCTICGAQFYRACNLSGHMRRKHSKKWSGKEPDKQLECLQCGCLCSSQDDLQKHYFSVHSDMFPIGSKTPSDGGDKALMPTDSSVVDDDHSTGEKTDNLEAAVDNNDADSSQIQNSQPQVYSPSADSVVDVKTEPVTQGHRDAGIQNANQAAASQVHEQPATATGHLPAMLPQYPPMSGRVQSHGEQAWQGLPHFRNFYPDEVKNVASQGPDVHKSVPAPQDLNPLGNVGRTNFPGSQSSVYQQGLWNSQQFSLPQSYSRSGPPATQQSVFPGNMLNTDFSQFYQQSAFPQNTDVPMSAASSVINSFFQDVFNSK